MARRKERLPAVYKFFKQNRAKFAEFLEVDPNGNSHATFLEFYEELYAAHYDEPDLRFGQHMFNNGVVKTDGGYYKEEDAWLIDNKLIPAEYIMTWGTLGINYVENNKAWNAAKPKLNTPITPTEVILGYKDLKNYEVYAKRYNNWLKSAPQYSYILLKDMSTEHIQAVLDTQPQIDRRYKEVFLKLLEQRLPNVANFKIVGSDVKC